MIDRLLFQVSLKTIRNLCKFVSVIDVINVCYVFYFYTKCVLNVFVFVQRFH